MDPNANLEEQRRLAQAILDRQDRQGEMDPCEYQDRQLADGERLAELVQALDQWISRGGFLPQGWKK